MIRDERGGDPKDAQLALCGFDAQRAGKVLADVVRMRGGEPTIDGATEAALWIVEKGGARRSYTPARD